MISYRQSDLKDKLRPPRTTLWFLNRGKGRITCDTKDLQLQYVRILSDFGFTTRGEHLTRIITKDERGETLMTQIRDRLDAMGCETTYETQNLDRTEPGAVARINVMK